MFKLLLLKKKKKTNQEAEAACVYCLCNCVVCVSTFHFVFKFQVLTAIYIQVTLGYHFALLAWPLSHSLSLSPKLFFISKNKQAKPSLSQYVSLSLSQIFLRFASKFFLNKKEEQCYDFYFSFWNGLVLINVINFV